MTLVPFSLSGAATAAVDAYIVEQLKAILQMLKPCCTEPQRKEYIMLLRAMAPVLKRQGDKSGMIKKVAARLEVPSCCMIGHTAAAQGARASTSWQGMLLAQLKRGGMRVPPDARSAAKKKDPKDIRNYRPISLRGL